MSHNKILVPVGPEGRDWKSVHHAMALAERLGAQVYILQWGHCFGGTPPGPSCLDGALGDLITKARQAGLNVSHLLVDGGLEQEIVNLVKGEGIDLLVMGAEERDLARSLLQIKLLDPSRIIQVKGKEEV